ncbi:hypothetical protein [Burkholderia sp. Bp8991]|uniref:hypothetical protein n=1 Tax=Burkholderia sp. Bp8991 TaxID=2184553 RepID=UPI000F5AD8FA|nr:hypothetical protein [Burkholderia sp. Bp8991]
MNASNTRRLSSRRSEFVSIRELVFSIAKVELQPAPEIATTLWNLLNESASPPDWVLHQDGVTHRIDAVGQRTGWFALRALREDRECHGGWDEKMGFVRSEIREFFDSRGLTVSPIDNSEVIEPMEPGPERDAAIRTYHDNLVASGSDKCRKRTAVAFGRSVTVIDRVLKRTPSPKPGPAVGNQDAWNMWSNDPFGRSNGVPSDTE